MAKVNFHLLTFLVNVGSQGNCLLVYRGSFFASQIFLNTRLKQLSPSVISGPIKLEFGHKKSLSRFDQFYFFALDIKQSKQACIAAHKVSSEYLPQVKKKKYLGGIMTFFFIFLNKDLGLDRRKNSYLRDSLQKLKCAFGV